jgi:hypothetical protein
VGYRRKAAVGHFAQIVQTQIEACSVTDVERMLNLDRPKYKITVIVLALNLLFANIVEPYV